MLTSSLVTLALGAQACTNAKYLDAARYFHVTARFMNQEPDQNSLGYQNTELQLIKLTAWARIGILADEHDKRRLSRISARLEQRVRAKTEAVKRDRQYATGIMTEEGEERIAGTTDEQQQHNESSLMDVDTAPLIPEALEEEKTIEICQLLNHYLSQFGALELNLQVSADVYEFEYSYSNDGPLL